MVAEGFCPKSVEVALRDLPPPLRPWSHALARALDARGTVEVQAADPLPHLADALVLHLDGGPLGTVTFRLGKTCAAALVTRLLRLGDGLERTSRPEDVPPALAAFLAKTTRELLGTDTSVRIVHAPSERACSPGVLLRFHEGTEPPLEAAVCVRDAHEVRPGSALALVDELQLDLPLVVAVSHAPWQELDDMAPGDIWMPDSGWLLPPDGWSQAHARALLGVPDGRRMAVVRPIQEGLAWDGETTDLDDERREPQEPAWAEVRVTAGSVRCSLRAWRELAPPITLPHESLEPWALWVAGELRARGTPRLWEGRWGVRLDEVTRPSGGPERR